MKGDKIWSCHGNSFYPADISATAGQLPMGIYTIHMDEHGNYNLEKIGNQFSFDFKIYGLESDFVRRVTTYYQKSVGNLGVLLNGVKGTGKSVTAKLLANNLLNPVLLVQRQTEGLFEFLNSIQQDITVLLDEYEKAFGGKPDDGLKKTARDASLLSAMDGAVQSRFRRTWILTTNELYLNDDLLNRPGRIRYLKEYRDLDYDTIIEILDDLLANPVHRKSIIEYCRTLELITVDILKAIVKEVNLFNEPPALCCPHMNISVKADQYSFVMLKGGAALMEPVSSSEKEEIIRKIIEGKSATSEIDEFHHPTSKGYLKFKEFVRASDEYVYTWNVKDSNGQMVETDVVCGWKEEKFIHSAFGR